MWVVGGKQSFRHAPLTIFLKLRIFIQFFLHFFKFLYNLFILQFLNHSSFTHEITFSFLMINWGIILFALKNIDFDIFVTEIGENGTASLFSKILLQLRFYF